MISKLRSLINYKPILNGSFVNSKIKDDKSPLNLGDLLAVGGEIGIKYLIINPDKKLGKELMDFFIKLPKENVQRKSFGN